MSAAVAGTVAEVPQPSVPATPAVPEAPVVPSDPVPGPDIQPQPAQPREAPIEPPPAPSTE